jgi:hypothetical protein
MGITKHVMSANKDRMIEAINNAMGTDESETIPASDKIGQA